MDPEEYKNIILKVTDSDTFSNKEVLKGLLGYLFEKTKKGITIKEIDIAIDYFKRDDGFISGDDTIVRVNIHKLRQLIEKYYNNEGNRDKIRIEIPKGSYNINFVDLDKNTLTLIQKSKNINIILLVALILSLIINFVLFFNPVSQNSIAYHPVWNDFINNYKAVSIILGDPFFYTKTNQKGEIEAVRNLEINSPEDLKKKHINSATHLDYPYFSKNNIIALPNIISLLSQTKKDIQIYALSEVNMENVKNNNQVFIANVNSFGFYKQFLEKTSLKISSFPKKIIVTGKMDSTVYEVPEKVEEYYNDYALMVKVPGPNNNIIILMGDFHATGNKGLVDLLNNNQKMKTFEKNVIEQYNEFPRFFEMIVKVSSFHYSDFKTEIIYFKKLDFNESDKTFIPEFMN